MHVLLDLDADRRPASGGEAPVDPRGDREDAAQIGAVVPDVLTAGLQERPELDAAMQVGVDLQHPLVGEEAAHDVLAEVGAVHPQDQLLGPPGLDPMLLVQHAGVHDLLGEARDVDADRVVAHPYRPALVVDGALAEVDAEAQVLLAGEQEVADVTARLEADDVVAQQTVDDLVADRLGQDLPVLGGWPGDVDEVLEPHLGHALAHHPRHQVELIVLDQDERRAVARLRLPDDAVGEHPVDRHVAVPPGVAGGGVHHGLPREVPEVMLDEPEQRVADHVVVEVVGLGAGLDKRHPVVGPIRRPQLGGIAASGEAAILLVARGRDPEGVGLGGERRERRHQPSGALDQPFGTPEQRIRRFQHQRGPVGDDDRPHMTQQPAGVGFERWRCQPPLWRQAIGGRALQSPRMRGGAAAGRRRHDATSLGHRSGGRAPRCPPLPPPAG